MHDSIDKIYQLPLQKTFLVSGAMAYSLIIASWDNQYRDKHYLARVIGTLYHASSKLRSSEVSA
jgi:hypothetical protein